MKLKLPITRSWTVEQYFFFYQFACPPGVAIFGNKGSLRHFVTGTACATYKTRVYFEFTSSLIPNGTLVTEAITRTTVQILFLFPPSYHSSCRRPCKCMFSVFACSPHSYNYIFYLIWSRCSLHSHSIPMGQRLYCLCHMYRFRRQLWATDYCSDEGSNIPPLIQISFVILGYMIALLPLFSPCWQLWAHVIDRDL